MAAGKRDSSYSKGNNRQTEKETVSFNEFNLSEACFNIAGWLISNI